MVGDSHKGATNWEVQDRSPGVTVPTRTGPTVDVSDLMIRQGSRMDLVDYVRPSYSFSIPTPSVTLSLYPSVLLL